MNNFLFIATLLVSSLGVGFARPEPDLYEDRFFDFKKKNKLQLVQMKIGARSMQRRDQVLYPQLSFVNESLLKGMREAFSLSDIQLLMGIKNPELRKKLSSKALYTPNNLYFEHNYSWKGLSGDEIKKINQDSGTTYSLVLELDNSMWRQEIFGRAYFYRGSYRVAVSRFNVVSTYIIKDKGSPYLSEYDEAFEALDNQVAHETEIKKIYVELGRLMGEKIIEKVYPVKKGFRYLGLEEKIAFNKDYEKKRLPLKDVPNPYPPEESEESFKAQREAKRTKKFLGFKIKKRDKGKKKDEEKGEPKKK